MKANYGFRLYSEFTKRNRTIKLYQMDFGQLAEWMKTFGFISSFSIGD
jgi:hypothetical protein